MLAVWPVSNVQNLGGTEWSRYANGMMGNPYAGRELAGSVGTPWLRTKRWVDGTPHDRIGKTPWRRQESLRRRSFCETCDFGKRRAEIASTQKLWCGRGDLNPHRPCGPADFHAGCGFRRPDTGAVALASGLRSGLSLHPTPLLLGLRCCPSSLYTFPANISVRAWLGIAIAGFPEFGQFCIAGFPACTQVALSPLRMPFRHARVASRLRFL